MPPLTLLVTFLCAIISCSANTDYAQRDSSTVIHVLVALCDNKNQGIVPVPAAIGNGQDPANNLYWGCGGGVKTFFKKSPNWKLLSTIKNPSANILERCVFKHVTTGAYLIADAYDGAAIKQCTIDFFKNCAGANRQVMYIDNKTIGYGGSSDMIVYIGHDGLMDFSLDNYEERKDAKLRDAIMLSCISKRYFQQGLKKSGANPILWSTGLMSPEAYTLEAALEGWLKKEPPEDIRKRAASAYNKYQKCGMKGAMNLLVTGY
jgi:hypothetical protein